MPLSKFTLEVLNGKVRMLLEGFGKPIDRTYRRFQNHNSNIMKQA